VWTAHDYIDALDDVIADLEVALSFLEDEDPESRTEIECDIAILDELKNKLIEAQQNITYVRMH
jgi:hypothetical protein